MSDSGYYYGWEAKVYLAVESTYGTASTTGSEYVQPAYVRGVGWNLNENVERIYCAGSGYRRGPATETKNAQEVTANLEFWMASDFDGTDELEAFLCKFPLDKYNVAYNATTGTWSTPETGGTYPGDSAYGSYSLLPFTLEVGHSKTGDIRSRVLKGCYVNSSTLRVAKGEKVTYTWDIVAASIDKGSSFVGTGTQSTNTPLDWSSCRITWTGEDDVDTVHAGCNALEITTNNNLEPDRDLSQVTGNREPTNYIPGKRDITGTMTWYKKTTTGQKWFEIVASATAGKTTPDNTIQLGKIILRIAQPAAPTKYVEHILYDVVIGELPEDVDFEKLQEITLSYTARYYKNDLVIDNTTGMTNWDNQAS